jgi:sugar lactone lactonase YvrE
MGRHCRFVKVEIAAQWYRLGRCWPFDSLEEQKMAAIRRVSLFALLMFAAVVGLASPAHAANHVATLMTFDATAGELPEGVAIDHRQTMYLSFPLRGEIRAITRDGVESTYATFPPGPGFGPLGIAIDAQGDLYVAVNNGDPQSRGVYRVRRDGSTDQLPGSEAITFPNDVTLDPRGNIYVTDTILGAVWRIPRDGGDAELWLQNAMLVGLGGGPLVFTIGANGIEFRNNAIYVGNTERGTIVRIPVLPDGTAGMPTVFAQSPDLVGADGLAFDVRGNLYVAVIAQSMVVRVSSDSHVTKLATTTDGLDLPSAIAFGTGAGERQTLFIVNFAISSIFGVPPGEGPALLSLDAGVAGQPSR